MERDQILLEKSKEDCYNRSKRLLSKFGWEKFRSRLKISRRVLRTNSPLSNFVLSVVSSEEHFSTMF